jgi:hypothetical protein
MRGGCGLRVAGPFPSSGEATYRQTLYVRTEIEFLDPAPNPSQAKISMLGPHRVWGAGADHVDRGAAHVRVPGGERVEEGGEEHGGDPHELVREAEREGRPARRQRDCGLLMGTVLNLRTTA